MDKDRITDIVKEYNQMYKIVIYKTPLNRYKIKKETKTLSMNTTEALQKLSQFKSIQRTKRIITDYVHCNDFDLFVTFTFDPKKVNRYDLTATYLRMQRWLMVQSRKAKEADLQFKYIIVPEQHKDGAIHFHALLHGYSFKLKQTNVIQDGRRVYNIPSYRWGFTSATKIPPDEKQRAINYASKYITKDMTTLPNKRRYWASKNLAKPVVEYNSVNEYDFNLTEHTIVDNNPYANTHQVIKNLHG